MIDDEKRRMYNHEKDMKEQAYHEEVERIRLEREVETTRLRALQEKASDKQSLLDELRNQRIQAHEPFLPSFPILSSFSITSINHFLPCCWPRINRKHK